LKSISTWVDNVQIFISKYKIKYVYRKLCIGISRKPFAEMQGRQAILGSKPVVGEKYVHSL